MNWKWKLCRLGGVDLYLHWTLAFLLLWVGMGGFMAGAGVVGVTVSLVCVAMLFGLVVMHEFAHAWAARAVGIGTHSITLLPIGGVAQLAGSPSKPRHELLIAAAGPASNLALAAILGPLAATATSPLAHVLLSYLISANLMLALFNLLPAFPMDGGRMLRAALAERGGGLWATHVATRVSMGVAILMGLWGLATLQLGLMLIAAYVWLAASVENATVGYFGGFARQPRRW